MEAQAVHPGLAGAQVAWSLLFIWSHSRSLSTAMVLGKLLGALLLRALWAECFSVGIAMISRGEVGLIFAELGRTSGILSQEVHAALIIVAPCRSCSRPGG